jgi:hypothetical protein
MMNERIKQLAEQATSLYETMDGEWEEDFDKEKFAELMVIEFSDVVKQTANELAESGFRQGQSEEEVMKSVNGALAVLTVMRERFEVGMTTEDKKTLIKELLGVKND